MEPDPLTLTEDDIFWIKICLGILLLIPALYIFRFAIYLILPKFLVKFFFKKHQGKKEGLKKRDKKFYED